MPDDLFQIANAERLRAAGWREDTSDPRRVWAGRWWWTPENDQKLVESEALLEWGRREAVKAKQ